MPAKSSKPSQPARSANDVLVTDGDAAMRKFEQATRAALNVPKAEVDAMLAKEKEQQAKPKKGK